MTDTIPRPRTEQLSTPDDLVRKIGTKILKICPDYVPGDTIECDYGSSIPGILDVCEVTIEPEITTVVRDNDLGYRVGVLSSKDRTAGLWVANENGVGVPDTANPDAAAWIAGELATLHNNMGEQGTLSLTPDKKRLAG